MTFNYSFCIMIVLIILLKIKIALCSDYYRMQDGYLNGNSLQPGEPDIEDFFWTGSGDGPYINRKPMLMPDSNVGDSFIRTATILATVYVNDNSQDISDDPLCTYDCNNLEMPEKYSPSDRRFWLLTIIAGFFGPEDYPVLEDKLAQLYRIAFMRQQARHLGFENGLDNETATIQQQARYSRKKRKADFYLHPRIKHRIFRREAENMMNNLTGIHYVTQNLTHDKGRLIKPRRGIKVNVLIHNMTLLTDAETGVSDDDVNPNENATKYANQTEIIYTVFVGGKPVLATTAANDMQYVTTEEVAKVMDKMVYTKSEPYLKEPHATPLIPASANGNSYIIQLISENPFLFILTCLTFFLLIVLLIGILLITTSKRKHKNEALKSARETLMEVRTPDDNNDGGIVRTEEIDGDLENLNLERVNGKNKKHTGSPVLHFPLPPGNRPASTSSSTSDSSLYYQRQPLRSEKKIDDRYAMRRDENLYTMILNKKEDKRQDKRSKTRRKYMTENRVGSIDGSKTQTNSDSDLFETNANIQSIAYDHNEAFNPNVQLSSSHYHKNKMMLDHNFAETGLSSKSRGRRTGQNIDVNTSEGIEAINKELLKTLQRQERSSLDSGSIGSYLSMASVKSFPRCGVPEPLSRVLEPLSVTHLDHYDADVDTTKTYRTLPSELDRNFHRSSSDGADPGVVGPIVWEMHKHEVEKKTVVITSPIRDPVRTRNRFEGLLEGAIKLYEGKKSDDKKPKSDSVSPTIFRDFRGKSAPKVKNAGNLSRNGSGIMRPFTAGMLKPSSTHSTQPPSPANKRAWSSGAPSPMVRPMSAGPFHRPAPPAVDVARVLAPEATVDRSALSTAPLIQAIQDELKKFNKN